MSYDINPTNGSKVIGAVIITRWVQELSKTYGQILLIWFYSIRHSGMEIEADTIKVSYEQRARRKAGKAKQADIINSVARLLQPGRRSQM
jgi:hypothetical protein